MLASVFDTVTGLPTHILVVHAVVVLVPLCFIGVCIAAASQTWRQRLAVPILVLLAVSFVSSLIAIQSGKALRKRLGATPTINHHAHLGIWVPVFVAAALLLYEHSLVRGDDLSRLDAAFFTMNGVISLTFFGFVLAERLVR